MLVDPLRPAAINNKRSAQSIDDAQLIAPALKKRFLDEENGGISAEKTTDDLNRKFIGFATTAIHAGNRPERWDMNQVVPPISLSTTYKQSKPGEPKGHDYSRAGNPTRDLINQQNKKTLRDGQPFRYISGEMHYFRIHPSLWQDRLWRYRAAGLNAVQLYIPWNFHEPTPAKFNFADDRNVSKFIRMAQKNELNVLIRLGPYICAEFEFGGLPWWLIKYQADIVLRSSNQLYLHFLRRWYDALLPMLKPLLYKNGGPILMLQIENEYGSVACDHKYMRWLRDLTREKLGDDVVLYTTDGPSDGMLRCGPIEHTLTTVDFGVPSSNIERNIEAYFALQQKYSAGGGGGPRVNSEFYTVWFSMWGDKSMVHQQTGPVIESMDVMWRMNASFSILMFHGGTSFGFWSGKETSGPVGWRISNLKIDKKSQKIVTSYDFGAPIGEEGAITPLYQAIRDWIGRRPAAEWPSRPMALPANRT
uniref:Cystathionine gamma-lyase n=1 Tax=Globodera pallida TaxID=36090 RepID=A0A183BI37_GLOPA